MPAVDGGGRRWLCALLLVALVFAAFWPSLSAGFVNWDDDKNFVENVHWRGLAPSNLAWMFTSYHMAHWHPVTWMSLGLDCVLFGQNPARMHLVNVLLQALAALAAFGVGRALFRAVAKDASSAAIDAAAFFAAAFFAVHPLRAESVAWITERRDVLSGLFFFLALRAWLGYVGATEDGPRRRAWLLSLGLFALAGMSKVAVFVLPFLLFVLDAWPLGRLKLGLGALVKEKLAHLGVAVALMAVAFYGQRFSAGTMYGFEDYPLGARFVQVGYATFFYPFKTLVPAGLSPMYELPPTEAMFTATWFGPAIAGAAAALIALLLWKKAPALAVAWLLFLITIAPTSGLTQAGSQIVADRYSYLACIPFAFLAGGALFLAFGRGRAPTTPGVVLGGVLALALVWRCHAQTTIWTSSEKLWMHALAIEPNDTVALSNLAEVRLAQGSRAADPKAKGERMRESIELLGRAFEISKDPRHLLNASAAMRKMGDAEPERFEVHLENAWKQLEEGYALAKAKGEPKPIWRRMRAELLLDKNQVAEALAELGPYLQQEPEDAEGHYLMGLALASTEKAAEALPHLEFALSRMGDDVRVWASLADAQGQLGRLAAARNAWTRVIELQRQTLGPAAASDPYVQLAADMLKRLGGK
ncbi:MAG: hypothetical protein IPJ77_15730 [Planctomycetes bacterium]|nr:hypothetical protein [Planctomycetota bacterium]